MDMHISLLNLGFLTTIRLAMYSTTHVNTCHTCFVTLVLTHTAYWVLTGLVKQDNRESCCSLPITQHKPQDTCTCTHTQKEANMLEGLLPSPVQQEWCKHKPQY